MRKWGDVTPPKNSSFLTAELKDTEVGDVKFYEEKSGQWPNEITNEHTNLT